MKRVIAFFTALLFAASAIAGPFAAVASSSPYQGSYTFTALPTCGTSSTGATARASDIGVGAGMALVCDGTRWTPDGVQVLSRSSIPVGIAPSGTMANNGAITLGTALPTTYTSIYLFLPANAIVAGSAAGSYYAVMSSTTVGQVFNNVYTSGIPTIPASPTPFVTTGPGAYAAPTSRTTLITLTVPGGLLGLSGWLEAESMWSQTNNANVKTPVFSFGGTDTFPGGLLSQGSSHDVRVITNRGSASSQMTAGPTGGWGLSSSAPTYPTVNTAVDVTVKFDLTKTTATDWGGIESFRLKVSP